MKLYEIPPAFDRINAQIDESDGLLTQDLAKELDSLNSTLESKVAGIVGLIKNLESEADAFANEMTRLAQKSSVRKMKAEWLRDYLKMNLERLNIDKVQGGIHGCRIQKNSQPTVTVSLPPEELHSMFRKTVCEVDKKAILEAHKDGMPLGNGIEVKVGTHLRIT